jgi:hypothetical protein
MGKPSEQWPNNKLVFSSSGWDVNASNNIDWADVTLAQRGQNQKLTVIERRGGLCLTSGTPHQE